MTPKYRISERRRYAFRNFLLILFMAVLSIAMFFVMRSISRTKTPENAQASNTAEPVSTPAFVPRSITITAAGDIMLHQSQLDAARQDDGTYDFSDYFTEVTPYLSSADLTFVNLETTLLGRNYSGFPRFSAPDSILDAMKAAGFDVVNTCNNHTLDTNWEGIVRTIDTVKSYGFTQVGTFKTAEDYHKPPIIDVNGIKIGVVSYTKNVNGRDEAITPEHLSYCIRFYANADYARDVQECRAAGADIVVAVLHWGYEYERTPRDAIRAEAKEMLEAGVDLILGSHPHVVQPIEIMDVTRSDGTTARCAVVYSMGNFISNQRDRYSDSGIIFNITLTEDEQGRFQIADMSYLPTYVNRKSDLTDYRILPINEYIDDSARLDTLDSDNRQRLTQAWNDITAYLEDGSAVLVSAP